METWLVDVVKVWVNFFHFCWRWVNVCSRWLILLIPYSMWVELTNPTTLFSCFTNSVPSGQQNCKVRKVHNERIYPPLLPISPSQRVLSVMCSGADKESEMPGVLLLSLRGPKQQAVYKAVIEEFSLAKVYRSSVVRYATKNRNILTYKRLQQVNPYSYSIPWTQLSWGYTNWDFSKSRGRSKFRMRRSWVEVHSNFDLIGEPPPKNPFPEVWLEASNWMHVLLNERWDHPKGFQTRGVENANVRTQRFRLIKDGHLPQETGKETWDFQRICAGLVDPGGKRLGERQRRTAWLARHSKDTAKDHLVQTCL